MSEHEPVEGVDYVELPADCILWEIHPSVVGKDGEHTVIELRWGWTAHMSVEEESQLEPDVPRGYGSVRTTLESVIRLRDRLNELIAVQPDETT